MLYLSSPNSKQVSKATAANYTWCPELQTPVPNPAVRWLQLPTAKYTFLLTFAQSHHTWLVLHCCVPTTIFPTSGSPKVTAHYMLLLNPTGKVSFTGDCFFPETDSTANSFLPIFSTLLRRHSSSSLPLSIICVAIC